jgi:hypothetical protein
LKGTKREVADVSYWLAYFFGTNRRISSHIKGTESIGPYKTHMLSDLIGIESALSHGIPITSGNCFIVY